MNTSEKIWTAVAIFISCLALAVSIVQTNIMQKQSHAAVWPRLANGQGFGPDYFNYTVQNEGVGPALISKIQFSYKDTSFEKIHELIEYLAVIESKETNKSMDLNFSYSTIYVGEVIGASEIKEVFTANDSLSVHLGKKYLLETNILVEYCSIYDRCWQMRNDTITALK